MKKSGNRYKFAILVIVVLSLALFTGCETFDNFVYTFIEDTSSDDSDVIYIGVFEPESGEYSDEGEEEIRGIELANSIYSKVQDKEIKLIYIDNKSSVATAESTIQDLIEMQPVAIIGSVGEAISLVASAYVDDAQIPMIITSATNPLITENNSYCFRIATVDTQAAAGIAEYACSELDVESVAIISIENDSSSTAIIDAFTESMEDLGKEDAITYETTLATGDTDMEEVVANIRASGATAVLVALGSEQASLLFDEIEEEGLTDIVFLGTSDYNKTAYVSMLSKHEDITVVFPSDVVATENLDTTGDMSPEAQKFIIEYTNAYGADAIPTQYAALGYDAYLVLINAIASAESTDGETLRDALISTSGLSCVTGEFSFDENGNAVRTISLSTVSNGEIVTIYETSSTESADTMKKITK